MIPRNLQNVSKTASHSNKYALLNAHKRNFILNHTLHSMNKNKIIFKNNSTVTYKQKYCFSKTKQSDDKSILTPNIKDIISPNLNLSDKQHSNIQNIFDYLWKTGQKNIMQFISTQLQLRTSRDQCLSKQSIKFLTDNEPKFLTDIKNKSGKGQTYVKLSFIQSTPNHSITTAENELKLSENDILHGIHRSSTIINKTGESNIYHGWINETTATTKTYSKKPPKEVQSFVKSLTKNPNIKQQTITIAVIDDNLKKTFKDIIIYALSLEGESGGFHKMPKWASTPTLTLTSTKVIAKSTEMSREDEDEYEYEYEYDNNGTLLTQVERIENELKERVKKQEYRSEHLKKWQYNLENREKKVDDEKKHITQIDSNMKNREQNIYNQSQQLSKTSNDLKWKDLKYKRNLSEIEYQKQILLNMNDKLNEQYEKLKQNENELEQKEQNINDIEKKLNEQTKTLIQNQNNIKQTEEKLNIERVQLNDKSNTYLKDKELLNQKGNEIKEELRFIESEKLKIEQERNILNKDENEWMEKVKYFKQRNDEINEGEIQLEKETNKVNKQKDEIEKQKEIIRINMDKNDSKCISLEEKNKVLEEKETKLREKGKELNFKDNLLNDKQIEFNKLENELKQNENIYHIEIKKLKENKLRFEKNKNEFDINNKSLKEKQLLYEKDAKELSEEQRLLDIKLKDIQEEKIKINSTKEDIIQQQNKLDCDKIQLNKDKIWLEKEINSLKTQQNQLQQTKMEIGEKEKDINKRFVELNNERNKYQNDKLKTQQLENKLNIKQKELENTTKINDDNYLEIKNKYNQLKKEEKEIMNKIEPIKEKEIMLKQKEIENNKQLQVIETQNTKVSQAQKILQRETIELKQEQNRLINLEKQLQNKQIKIFQQDKRVTNMYDEFNKEKYKISKLEQSLQIKEDEIIQREENIIMKQQIIDQKQITINNETEVMIERKKQFETLQNEFDIKQKKFDFQQKEFEEKLNRLKCDQMELDNMNKTYIQNQKILEDEKMKIDGEINIIKQQKDYIKQQNQSLSLQKKELDSEKLKIEQNGLLLATRTQQLQQETERLKSDYSKLEKINIDLKAAQIKHKQEDEKLRIWKTELENEQEKLNKWQESLMTRTKTLDTNTLKLNEQEIKLEEIAKSLENKTNEIKLQNEKLYDINKKEAILVEKENILKQQFDSQKEKEQLIEISKQQILFQQKEIVSKEKLLSENTIKLNQTLKDVNDTKYELNIEMVKKETELLNKQNVLRDTDLNISKMEREIKEKEIKLKNKENELKEKGNELLNLQRELDLNKTQIRMEIKRNKDEINNERLEIKTEKNNLLKQKEIIQQEKVIQSEHEKELNMRVGVLTNKCDELQNEIYEMESNILILNNKLSDLTDKNNVLIEEKQLLNDNIIQNHKLMKQLKKPIDEQNRLMKEKQIENYKQEEYIKHLMSSVKKKQRFIESKENKIMNQENELMTKIETQKQKETDIELTIHKLQTETVTLNKMRQDIDNDKKIYEEKLKLVTGLQQNLKRTQDICGHKDIIINQLQNKYSEVNSNYIKQKNIQINMERIQNKLNYQQILINRLQNENNELKKKIVYPLSPALSIKYIQLSTAEKTSQISKHNVSKLPSHIEPKAIDINIVKRPTFADLTSLQQRIIDVGDETLDLLPESPKDDTLSLSRFNISQVSNKITPQSIPITETILSTQKEKRIVSKPINNAEPLSIISKHNQPSYDKIMPQTIPINIPYEQDTIKKSIITTATQASQMSKRNIPQLLSYIEPKSISITGIIPITETSIIETVPLSSVTPTSQMSRHNMHKLPSYIEPKSIDIKTETIVSTSFDTAEPISTLSRYNRSKLLTENIISMIPITSIIEATDNLLPPHIQKTLNLEQFKQDIKTLKELDENGQVEAKIEIEELKEDIKLESKLNENDLDVLFQCTTNKDLLFDDIKHIDTIFCELNDSLKNCLMECRDYKSMIKELPSQFKSNITDIFTGDVICCLEWKFGNNQYDNLCNNVIPNIIEKCNKAIDGNRELIKQYNIAIKDDKKRSVSNRNKLRRNNKFSNRDKMDVFDINKNINGEFKNDLEYELLALQYENSEWLLMQSIVNEWSNYIKKLKDIDSDALYLRSFCILPSQTIEDRTTITCGKNCNYLSNQLQHRKWVRELNNSLNKYINNNFDIYYDEISHVNNWKDKLLIRDLISYLLNGTTFELNSEQSKYIPLSEGFIRIGYQSQLLIESAQSLLGYIDPYIEQIITSTQDWINRDDNINIGSHRENIELSLQNGKELIQIHPSNFKTKTSVDRAKMLETDAKYATLFKNPLTTDLHILLSQNEVDTIYMKKFHKFLRTYFEKVYRDELMLPTANSTIIEETAPQTWQNHAVLEAVYNDEFYKILQLLSNEKVTKQICDFISYNVYEMNKEHLDSNEQQNRSLKMYNELFKPFEIFKEYYEINVKQKMYEIISDFDIQEYLSENIYQIALKNKSDNNNGKEQNELWYNMKYANSVLKPLQFKRDYDMKDVEMPEFTEEERLATYWTGYLKGVLNGVPVERPIRLPEQYHDITTEFDDVGYLKHLKQHYYIDSYKPPSHEDTAERISIEDKMNGVDIYRDQYIQRPHQSKRILETKLQFLFHNKLDYMKGAFPLQNFNELPCGTKKPIKHRVTVRKSTFVQAGAQENYETRIYSKIATNYKLTSNRTADMFNARGFDLIYDSIRVM